MTLVTVRARLIQIADIFGEHGVSFLVAMTNGLVVDALTRPWFQHTHGKRRFYFGAMRVGSIDLGSSAIGGAWGYGSYRIAQTNALPQNHQLQVAVVQTNVTQDNKNKPTIQQLMGRLGPHAGINPTSGLATTLHATIDRLARNHGACRAQRRSPFPLRSAQPPVPRNVP